MFNNQVERNISFGKLSLFPITSDDNLSESEEIEEKFNLNPYEDPFIDKLRCNHLPSFDEPNRNIVASLPQNNNYNRIILNQNIIFDGDDEENIDYECYFTTKTKTKTKTNPKYLFDIKRKRYRDKKENLDINNLSRKFDKDNIISKIKNSYTNCTIDLFNQIIESKNEEKIKFYHLKHDISKKSTKNEIKEMKVSSIEKFISKEVSTKFCKNKRNNAEICSIIKNDEKLKNIAKLLDFNFLFFFEKIYRQKRKEIYRLSDYDLPDFSDIIFKLPKEIELYDDLVEKNKNEPFFEKYKTEMEICCKLYFIPDEKCPEFIVKKIKGKKK